MIEEYKKGFGGSTNDPLYRLLLDQQSLYENISEEFNKGRNESGGSIEIHKDPSSSTWKEIEQIIPK